MSTMTDTTAKLFSSFHWFEKGFLPLIKKGCDDFWESKFEIKLYSITSNEAVKKDLASKGETYFITQLPINAHQNATFRLSSDFARIYLHTFLGSSSPNFKLMELSELEVRVLNSFNEYLLKTFSDYLIPYEQIPKYLLREKGEYHLTFIVKKDDGKSSKIVLSLPQNILNPQPFTKVENFKMEDFEKMSTFVNIKVGSTKITLNDLRDLYSGDIILLENSNIHKMLIKTGNIEREFKVNPNPSLIIDLDEENNDLNDSGGQSVSGKNLWDDIQIEVNAEFNKVKMTLGELKQISTGLVVDLGSAFDNRISLVVEDKLVARGELVIINDRYGVKIEEVFASPHINVQPSQSSPVSVAPDTQQIQQSAPAAEVAPGNSQQASPPPVEEDFDYSDFEDEDE